MGLQSDGTDIWVQCGSGDGTVLRIDMRECSINAHAEPASPIDMFLSERGQEEDPASRIMVNRTELRALAHMILHQLDDLIVDDVAQP